jgi:hypothetical protein
VQRYNLAIIVPLIEEFRVLRELVPSHIHNPEVEDAIYYYPLDLGEPDYQAVIVIRPQPGPHDVFRIPLGLQTGQYQRPPAAAAHDGLGGNHGTGRGHGPQPLWAADYGWRPEAKIIKMLGVPLRIVSPRALGVVPPYTFSWAALYAFRAALM